MGEQGAGEGGGSRSPLALPEIRFSVRKSPGSPGTVDSLPRPPGSERWGTAEGGAPLRSLSECGGWDGGVRQPCPLGDRSQRRMERSQPSASWTRSQNPGSHLPPPPPGPRAPRRGRCGAGLGRGPGDSAPSGLRPAAGARPRWYRPGGGGAVSHAGVTQLPVAREAAPGRQPRRLLTPRGTLFGAGVTHGGRARACTREDTRPLWDAAGNAEGTQTGAGEGAKNPKSRAPPAGRAGLLLR